MKTIGIAGGIGSGKSTVTNYLIEKKYKVLDADQMAREIVMPGTRLIDDLVDTFGQDIVVDGELDRKALGAVVFSDVKKKRKLDEMTHGAIKKLMESRLTVFKDQGERIVFIDAPLFFEAGLDAYVDKIWLIKAPKKVKILRAISRDNSTAKEVEKVMSFQMTDKQREEKAENTGKEFTAIDNSKNELNLYKQIDRALEKKDRPLEKTNSKGEEK